MDPSSERPRPVIRIEALAADIDGTLLDRSHRLTPRTKDAVSRLVQQGVHVILATSRYPAAVRAIHQELGLGPEPIVACQGGVVARFAGSAVEVLTEHPLDLPAVRGLTRFAQGAGLGVSYYSGERWVAQEGDALAWQEAEITGVSPTLVRRLIRVRRPPSKVTLMARPSAVSTLAPLVAAMPTDFAASISRPDYVEVVATGVSKWTAARSVLRTLGLSELETAAIGDGDNDLDMIQNAGLGIAMGHAPPRVQAAAHWVVPSNAQDGFADAVDRLCASGLL